MAKHGAWVALLAALLSGGCGDDGRGDDADGDADADSDGDTDADTDADADGDTDADSDGDADTDGDGDADSDGDGDGDADQREQVESLTIDLELVPDDGFEPSAADPKIGVMWFQLSDDGPDPDPVIDVFEPPDELVGRVGVTLTLAPPETLWVCMRACDDEAACGCDTMGLGMALFFVWDDESGDDWPDENEPIVGFAEYNAVIYLSAPLDATGEAGEVEDWIAGKIETEQAAEGLHLVDIVRDEDIFDHFRLSPEGKVVIVREAEDPDGYEHVNLT